MVDPILDHVVLAGPDVDELRAAFVERTGIEPELGGRHPSGTRNYLVRLGEDSYLEIIGPDVQDPSVPKPTAFGIDTLTEPRVASWLVHPADIEKTVADSRAAGYDPGDIAPLSRQKPDGTVLEWRLTLYQPNNFGGLVPGLIDWLDAQHPSKSGLPEASLVSFSGRHPDVAAVRAAHEALGISLDLTEGTEPGLTLVIDTPKGRVTLW